MTSAANTLLRKGLRRFSATVHHALRRRFKFTRPKPAAAPAAEKPAAVKVEKKAQLKKAKFLSQRNALPLNDRRKRHHYSFIRNAPKLRSSIIPGRVLILLAGRYRGKRVVFLKQLPSGLLLITGPFKINGVPLRRVSQRYVVATSTKVPLKDLKIDPEQVNDLIFSKRQPQLKKRKSAAAFFGGKDAAAAPKGQRPVKKQKKVEKAKIEEYKKKRADRKAAKAKAKAEAAAAPAADKKAAKQARKQPLRVSHDRAKLQKAIDAQLLPGIKKVPLLKNYLSARFSLQNHEHPHLLKF